MWASLPPQGQTQGHWTATQRPCAYFQTSRFNYYSSNLPRGERRGRAGGGHVIGTGLSGIAGTDLPTHLQAGQDPHMVVLRAILCSSGRSTDTVNHTAPAGVTAEAHYSCSRLLSVDL